MEIQFCPRCGAPVRPLPRYGKVRPVCPACAYVHCPNPRVAVVLFLADGDRVLLVKRRWNPERGRWALPAGYVDPGERPEAAAAREMREETGLEVAAEGLVELLYDEASQAIVLLYRARLLGGELAAGDDAEEARWFRRDALPELAFESTRRAITAWAGNPA